MSHDEAQLQARKLEDILLSYMIHDHKTRVFIAGDDGGNEKVAPKLCCRLTSGGKSLMWTHFANNQPFLLLNTTMHPMKIKL